MKAMIFAAGLGTRLKPITDTLPKALGPVGGRPLIEHVLDKLDSSRTGSDGRSTFDGYVVNVHHFADKIEKWIEGSRWNDRTAVSDERSSLLETGGGILHARPLLDGCGQFLIHNVDILSDLDISWFASQVSPDALATLLVSDRKTSRYLLFDPVTMLLKGWTNISTGEVRSPYPDLDPSQCRALAFSGIHILSDKVFDVMDRYAAEKGLCNENKSADPRFPIMDFYLAVCCNHNIYGVEAADLDLVDVGKLDTLEKAEDFILRK